MTEEKIAPHCVVDWAAPAASMAGQFEKLGMIDPPIPGCWRQIDNLHLWSPWPTLGHIRKLGGEYEVTILTRNGNCFGRFTVTAGSLEAAKKLFHEEHRKHGTQVDCQAKRAICRAYSDGIINSRQLHELCDRIDNPKR